jgi:hypothetical protein
MSRTFQSPRPNFLLMRLLGIVNRWWMLLGLPGLRHVPLIRDLPVVRGRFRIRRIDLPRADEKRLRTAVNRNTAAFVAPNHPEFGFDWMMDKHIQTLVAPRMASWASHDIIASAPVFWTRNNLIAHNGGDAAMELSVKWALQGDGVLLHPEGTVHWTGDVIHPLFRGMAEMACTAAPRAAHPVFVVPIVWKLRYVSDISDALHHEMRHIERSLGLATHASVDVAERFRALQDGILRRQMRAHELGQSSWDSLDFFARQATFRSHLVDDLRTRYDIEPSQSIDKTIARHQREISSRLRQSRGDESSDGSARRNTMSSDLAMAEEASRLGGFSKEAYGGPRLTQEQIAESLKRVRATLVTRGRRNAIHNFLPAPYGPRVAHVRVPDPILVDPIRAAGPLSERQAYVAELTEGTRTRMQQALDEINREIAADTQRWSHRNPFTCAECATASPPAPVSPPDLPAYERRPADRRPESPPHAWRHSHRSPRS